MKAFRLLFALGVALFLSACASTKVIEGDSPQARAGNALAQVEVALIKGYRYVADQAAVGVLLKSELQAALEVLDRVAVKVDQARELYKRGLFGGALDKVLDADQSLAFIEAEIAKKLKERRQPVSLGARDEY